MNGEAVTEIARLVQTPALVTAGGREWVTMPDGWTMADPSKAEPRPDFLALHTLTGVVDYVVANRDGLVLQSVMLHVCGPRVVHVLSQLQPLAVRFRYVEATVTADDFRFGQFYDTESFVVALQSLFEPSEERAALLALVGNIRDSKVSMFDDDGITQTVTAKQGVALSQLVKAPNPITLRPYRTFREVEQPASQFVFRLQGKDGAQPACALFEADGGRWRLRAVENIAAFLRGHVPDHVVVVA
jgi:hypothetical protein